MIHRHFVVWATGDVSNHALPVHLNLLPLNRAMAAYMLVQAKGISNP